MELPYTRRELIHRARTAGFARTEVICAAFWQSLSAHWGRSLLGCNVDWDDRPSRLDRVMGLMLLLFGWHGDESTTADSSARKDQ
jgi:hypothetical protein